MLVCAVVPAGLCVSAWWTLETERSCACSALSAVAAAAALVASRRWAGRDGSGKGLGKGQAIMGRTNDGAVPGMNGGTEQVGSRSSEGDGR